MLRLLKKEIRLAMHPTAPMFLLLSAMLLIPSYPFYVVFFYTGLGIFFTCLTGREQKDIDFTLLLPVSREEAVKGRFALVALLEVAQLAAAALFAALRAMLGIPPNAAGMEANIALFGFALMLLAVFNLIFLPMVYKQPARIGVPFMLASTAVFLMIFVLEAAVHIVPFFRDILDTPDPMHLTVKICLLMLGAVVWAGATLLSLRMSIRCFRQVDL